jgi:hypothetical protein
VKAFDPDPSLRRLFCFTHPDDELGIAAWVRRLTGGNNEATVAPASSLTPVTEGGSDPSAAPAVEGCTCSQRGPESPIPTASGQLPGETSSMALSPEGDCRTAPGEPARCLNGTERSDTVEANTKAGFDTADQRAGSPSHLTISPERGRPTTRGHGSGHEEGGSEAHDFEPDRRFENMGETPMPPSELPVPTSPEGARQASPGQRPGRRSV